VRLGEDPVVNCPQLLRADSEWPVVWLAHEETWAAPPSRGEEGGHMGPVVWIAQNALDPPQFPDPEKGEGGHQDSPQPRPHPQAELAKRKGDVGRMWGKVPTSSRSWLQGSITSRDSRGQSRSFLYTLWRPWPIRKCLQHSSLTVSQLWMTREGNIAPIHTHTPSEPQHTDPLMRPLPSMG
jgi:hypothetical protein